MKQFIKFMQTEETGNTPMLDKIMIAGAIVEISVILFIICFFIRLGMWGMII